MTLAKPDCSAVLIAPGLARAVGDFLVEFATRSIQHPESLVKHAKVEVHVGDLGIASGGLLELRAGFIVLVKIQVRLP